MYLEEFLKYYAKTECNQLYRMTKRGNGKMSDAVVDLLKKHGANKKTIDQFVANTSEKVDEKFQKLMQEAIDAELLKSKSSHSRTCSNLGSTTPKS